MSGDPSRATEKNGRARRVLPVAALGTNLWIVGVLWPLLATESGSFRAYLAATAALLPLVAGTVLLAREGPVWLHMLGEAAWLALFPIACGAVIAAWPEAGERALGTPSVVLLALALCGYAAAAARTCAPEHPTATITRVSRAKVSAATTPRARRWLRSAVVVLCVAGAVALSLVAPGETLAALGRKPDEHARASAVLTAVVGSALGCTLIAVFLASGLRTDAQPREPRLDASLRAAWFLLLALLGGVTYYVVQP